MKMKKKITVVVAAIVLAVCACIFAAGCQGCGTVTYEVNMNSVSLTTYNSYTEMISEIRPMVVEVYGEGYKSGSYFTSAGAGVIISKTESANGYIIVTNQHVVEDCYDFYVNVLTIADDGTESTTMYKADFIGGSHERDIAVLSIRSNDELSCAEWMDSDDLRVGADVVAIGNPTGTLGGTVTKGIISATSRKIDVENIGSMDLIQFDAAINSGNSGGALFCTVENDGKYTCALAGIVNAGTDDYEGLAFAIPANDAKFAVESLLKTYNTDDEIYGYVEGDAGLSLTVDSYTAYKQTLVSSGGMFNRYTYSDPETMIYVYSTSSGSLSQLISYETYNSSMQYQYFHAIRTIKINDDKEIEVTSADDVYDALENVVAGDTLQLGVERMTVSSGRMIKSGSTETLTITAEQYRYTPPSDPASASSAA